MTCTPDHKPHGIHAALVAVMRDIPAVPKNERNAQQGFQFRGIDGVKNAVGPVLRRHGVSYACTSSVPEYDTVEVGVKRTPMARVVLSCVWTWYAEDGSTREVVSLGEAFDSGDKGTAKAQSVAERVMLLQTLCLPTDEPDPDHDTYERSDVAQSGNGSKPPQSPGDSLELATREELVGMLHAVALAAGKPFDEVNKRFLEANSLASLDAADDSVLRSHVRAVVRHAERIGVMAR